TDKVLIDSAGNIFAAGTIYNFGDGSPSDFLISKLNTDGVELGQFRFTPANVVTHGSRVTDAVLDPFGNLLVTGITENASFNNDIYTLRIPQDFASEISGRLALQGMTGASPQQALFTFRPTNGGPAFSMEVTLNADHTFALNGIPRDHYTLHVKADQWLAHN